MPRCSFLATLVTFYLAFPASIAIGQLNEPVWGADEIVDSGQIEITQSSGPGVIHTADWAPWTSLDQWHVVYAKAGDIYHAVRLSTGWQPPEQLTADSATSKEPKFAFARNRLIVVWEDDRRGHPEIWSREWDGTAWSTEVGLADDAIPSQAAVITGLPSKGYVAWQEGTAGQTRIVGRPYTSLGWGAVEAISSGSAPAIEPSIGSYSWENYMHVAWADARDGSYEIYSNENESGWWWGDTRFTNLTGSCRRPCVSTASCCSDVLGTHSLIAFENDATGVAEVWVGCTYFGSHWVEGPISVDDGRASQRPQPCAYPIAIPVGMGGTYPRHPVTWTEEGAPGERTHLMGMVNLCGQPIWVDTLTTSGIGTSGVAAQRGSPARLMTAWLEERDGQTTLIARSGTAAGCDGFRAVSPSCILLSPGGTRGNTILCYDDCRSGVPVAGVGIKLQFEPFELIEPADPLLIWDVDQSRPVTQVETTDADGRADLIVRGGGCSASEKVNLLANGVWIHRRTGVKSADINGDCAVLNDDLAYVTSKLGTADFCADLNGSGSVTEADVAIVQAELGSICSQLTGLGEPSGPAPRLLVAPNPARGTISIRIDATGLPGTRLEILDAAGRLVRSYDRGAGDHGMDAITWDGLDGGGRAVASGLYYARTGHPGGQAARPIVIIR